MARFLTETYTAANGTPINGKAADLGGTWASSPTNFDVGSVSNITDGSVVSASDVITGLFNNATPGSPNQDVTLEFTPTANNWVVCILLRRQSSNGQCYSFRMSGNDYNVDYLATGTTWPPEQMRTAPSTIATTNRTTHTFRASINSSGNLRAWIDGVEVSWTGGPISDTRITAAGNVGFWMRRLTSSYFYGDDDVAAGPTFSANPGNTTVTQPATASFSATYSGTITGHQWQVSTDGGTSWGSVPDGTGASGGSGTGGTLTYTTTATAVSTGNHRNGYRYRVRLTHSGGTVDSTAGILTVNAPDSTAPTLTSPSGTGGLGVASGSVSTNEGNGTLFAVATASTTQPSIAQIKAGQDHTGAAALRAVSQAVTATGTQTIASGAISGGAGTRYWHFMHEDAAGNRSAVVSSAGFSVTAPLSVTLTLTGENNVSVGAVTIPKVFAIRYSDNTLLHTFTGVTTNASGQVTLTHASLTATDIVFVPADNSGSKLAGAKFYTPA